ncbi:hypothetical protein [Pyxidicoccus trucidator]|uniref:hypothetical protein n=1 Tax=Pyxidicoccus trucidator TaxID=2709662 RepID=UPI0013DBF5B5|nr:hypothetical protein [Pyxidicoccus trucidator]
MKTWIFAVFAVAVAVSPWSASAQMGPPYDPCMWPYEQCMVNASYEGDPYLRELLERQCQWGYEACRQEAGYCGDLVCDGGETCSSCASDCTFTATYDKGTVTRNCSTTQTGTYIAYGEYRQVGNWCEYPVYATYAVTCNVYRITDHYNSCGNPPYTTQETYETSTTTTSRTRISTHATYGTCMH